MPRGSGCSRAAGRWLWVRRLLRRCTLCTLWAVVDGGATATLVRDAANAAGLTAANFGVLRIGNHIVLGSDDAAVVARVGYTRRRSLQYHVAHLRILAELAELGAPIVAALCEPCLLADGRVVTFWPMHAPAGRMSLSALVGLVSRCHRSVLVDGLAVWSPGRSYLTRWEDRSPLMEARGVPADVHAFLERELRGRVASLAACWRARSGAHRQVLIHGDAHPDNVVRRRGDGSFALIDLDSVAVGPPEVDLSGVRLHYVHHNRRRQAVDRMRAVYGAALDGGLLARIYAADEAIDCAWLACLWGVVDGAADELVRRLDRWDDPSARWRAF